MEDRIFHVTEVPRWDDQKTYNVICRFPLFGDGFPNLDVRAVPSPPKIEYTREQAVLLLTAKVRWQLDAHETQKVYYKNRPWLLPNFDNFHVSVFKDAADALDHLRARFSDADDLDYVCFPYLTNESLQLMGIVSTLYEIKISYLVAPDGRLWIILKAFDYVDYNFRALEMLFKLNGHQLDLSTSQHFISEIYFQVFLEVRDRFFDFLRGFDYTTFHTIGHAEVQWPEIPDQPSPISESIVEREVTQIDLEVDEETVELDSVSEIPELPDTVLLISLEPNGDSLEVPSTFDLNRSPISELFGTRSKRVHLFDNG